MAENVDHDLMEQAAEQVNKAKAEIASQVKDYDRRALVNAVTALDLMLKAHRPEEAAGDSPER